jgi:hypothetical protein
VAYPHVPVIDQASRLASAALWPVVKSMSM